MPVLPACRTRYLWVQGTDAVLRSLRACWASLYSLESVIYRLRLNLPESQVAMGVVIQRMLASRASGVMFTRSPVTGDRSVIAIEGSFGLGSAIVSGEVTPDKYVVNKVTGEIVNRTVRRRRCGTSRPSTAACAPTRSASVSSKCLRSAMTRSANWLHSVNAWSAITARRRISSGRSRGTRKAPNASTCCRAGPRPYGRGAMRKPVAQPAARAYDHVFAVLGRQMLTRRGCRGRSCGWLGHAAR